MTGDTPNDKTPRDLILALARCQAADAMLVGLLVDECNMDFNEAGYMVRRLGQELECARLGAQARACERWWNIAMGLVPREELNGYTVTAITAVAKGKLGYAEPESAEIRELLDRAKTERARRKGLHAV